MNRIVHTVQLAYRTEHEYTYNTEYTVCACIQYAYMIDLSGEGSSEAMERKVKGLSYSLAELHRGILSIRNR